MMKCFLILATLGFSASFATNAAAMNGREALASCTGNPKCKARVDDDGGVVIGVGGHTIYCPPADGECDVVYRRSGKALKDLPMATETGTANNTAVTLSPESLLKN